MSPRNLLGDLGWSSLGPELAGHTVRFEFSVFRVYLGPKLAGRMV